ncbi:PREDICTED: G-type lectin S-receptor-like serine/threonine-protein kinase At4g27290 isoform X2 [Lupinus angustifolius]|uniref:G-type lectin S-receptor-like serine/threonine-protein kinase At4g27290 isoform X2 n=1 Tax=Lupinus angustifolius TaxID=3871 RepID=UPI00092F0213|nr:PREDICTED: G-type lectin S-receptor-like serine/threonine-protein kinase At4g27290 isoform X2 [Lupinus angustifolius]
MMGIHTLMLVITKLILLISNISSATYTITNNMSLPDGKTLVSDDGTFELGFFNPGTSLNRYVGIWFKTVPVRTVVWVANREKPINDNSSMLIISQQGNLVLVSQNHSIIWSTNLTATTKPLSPIVQLLNNGNLVLKEENDNNNNEGSFLWQSFDYPSDTLLPEMKVGWDLKTGLNRRLTAWKSWDDPSPGEFSCGIVLNNYPEPLMWKGTIVYHRDGPWNGLGFSGTPAQRPNPLFEYKFVNNADEVYYSYKLKNWSVISILVMNESLYLRQRITWIPESKTWRIYQSVPQDGCDAYNLCGAYGNCIVDASPVCQCLAGFEPKSSKNWNAMDWTDGCVQNKPISCRVKGKDGFQRFTGMKAPATTHTWVNESMTLKECNAKCSENCSCTAYANSDVNASGSGCVLWFGDLIDLKQFSDVGQDLYIRMAVLETSEDGNAKDKKKTTLVITFTLLSVAGILFLFVISYIYWTKRKLRVKEKREITLLTEEKDESGQEDLELPFFDLTTIVNATNSFSNDKKLGEGGFGPVYKGILVDGQEIAVKRLSIGSHQGMHEFKNEVILCAKLQHRNLVKVIGCCIEGDEKMLVYEYMPNKSLDSFLFDSAKSKHLDWIKRFNVINGIVRGLLYLHHDSRLRIIHRDLKASNVLLDNNMNPKISDFGLARMCGGDQVEGNTSRIVGTYGYMAPEYAIHGLFSIKSDVFSFGILLLEIVSGMKSKGLPNTSQSYSLIGHAWKFWKDGVPMKLIDSCLEDSCIPTQAFRCIQIGLLCVQQYPDDRPNMASVAVMLSSENSLPQPKEPGFMIEKMSFEGESSSKLTSSSVNEVTISILDAR